MTDIQQFEEHLRCEQSVWYFTKYIKTEYKKIIDGYYETLVEPYPRYPYLKDMLDGFSKIGNIHDEKSRQMMWSWTAMVDTLHCLLFKDNYSEKVISRKENLVDDGGQNSTTDSLFGRLYFMWLRLPKFLKAELDFTHLRVRNVRSNSFAKGESTNTKAGRGGTYNKIKGDEWAFIDNSESVFSSIKSACPDNMKFGSTPYGKGNNFARLKFGINTGFKNRTFHWKLHPDRDMSWYDHECRGMTKEGIARELDLSYEGSMEGLVYYNFDHTTQVVNLNYDRSLPVYTTWDFGISDPTSILFIQVYPSGEICIIDEYENKEQEPYYYADIVNGKPYDYVQHVGDPAGKARGVTKKSFIGLLDEEGIDVETPQIVDYDTRVLTTRRIIPRVYVSDKCTLFLDRIMNYRYPVDPTGTVKEGSKPVHNWASHMMTALEFFALKLYPVQNNQVRAIL